MRVAPSDPVCRIRLRALHRPRLIEHWGTGTLRILEACKGYDLQPEFLSQMGCFIARITKKAVSTRRKRNIFLFCTFYGTCTIKGEIMAGAPQPKKSR